MRGLFLGLGLASALTGWAQEPAMEREEWAIIKMQGEVAGYHHSTVKKVMMPQGARYVTEKEEEIRMQRMGSTMKTRSLSRTTENERGVVLNYEAQEESQGMDMVSRGFRVGEQIVVLARGLEQRYAVASSTLGPYAAERLIRAMPLRSGEKISLSVFMSEFPQGAVTLTGEVLQKEKRQVFQQERELWKMAVEMSMLPGLKIFVWVDDRGEMVCSVMPFPGLGEIEIITTTREEALRGKGAPEIFVNSMVRPDKPLKNHLTLKEARLRLSGPKRLSLPAGREQEIVAVTDQATEILVRVPQDKAEEITWRLPCISTPELGPYLRPSPLIDANHPLIQKLARQVVGEEANPLRAARKIEAFVRSHIANKDLSVNFASAGETAQTKVGDCTEHGVLCAALGRAVGLPTRVVIGFGYLPTNYTGKSGAAKGEFGFHLWTEAWLGEDKWVALDAALGQFDVGHIAILKTPLESANPMIELAQPILSLMDNLKIEVLETK